MAAGDPIPWSNIATNVGTIQLTADSATWAASEALVTGFTVTPFLTSGQRYRVTLCCAISSDTANDIALMRVRLGSLAGAQVVGPQTYPIPNTSSVGFFQHWSTVYTAAATGAQLLVVSGVRTTGSGNMRIRAAAGREATLTVDLMP